MVSANSSTSAGGLARAAIGMRPTRNGASQAMTLRSACTRVATDGRCTLTTTRSPVRSVAACTWAIDAAASGARSKSANTDSSGRAQLGLDHGAHGRPRLGRHLVAALLELADQLLGEEPFAAGDDLAELDVGRAEVLGGDAQAAGDVGLRGAMPPLRRAPSAQAPTATPRWRATRKTRVPSGRRRGRVSSGTWRRITHRTVGDRSPPRHGVGIDQPGWVVAEGSDGQVGGGGHGGRSLRLGGAGELPGHRARHVGGRAGRRWPAGRLGRRRGQGRDPGRRPDAPAVPAARRPRPTRVAAVRPRQPGQAQRR